VTVARAAGVTRNGRGQRRWSGPSRGGLLWRQLGGGVDGLGLLRRPLLGSIPATAFRVLLCVAAVVFLVVERVDDGLNGVERLRGEGGGGGGPALRRTVTAHRP